MALTGSPAPGVAAATISSLGLPFIADNGHLVFLATLSGAGIVATNDRALYMVPSGLGPSLVLREGSPAPGTSYAFAGPGLYSIDANGEVAVDASLIGAPASANKGVWSGTASGLHLRELTGQVAPGSGTTFSNVYLSRANGSSSGSYIGSLNRLSNGRSGVWVNGAGGLRKVALEGEIAPGATATFETLALISMDPSGYVCYAGFLSDLRQGVWIENPFAAPVLLSGQPLPIAPGVFAQLSTIGRVSANMGKRIAFTARVTGSGVNNSNDMGIWTDRLGSFSVVARTGNAAPGLASVVLTNFVNVQINASNQVAYAVRLLGSGFSGATDMAVYLDDPQQGAKLIMHTGMPAPGTDPGVAFAYTTGTELGCFNHRGEMVFSAIVRGPGVTLENDTGYWSYSDNQLKLLIREGDDLEVSVGDWRTVRRVFALISSTGEDGTSSSLNNEGQLVFLVEFVDSSRGVFTTNIASQPKLSFSWTANGLELNWSGEGFTLEAKPDISSDWGAAPNQANPQIVPFDLPSRFFRLSK